MAPHSLNRYEVSDQQLVGRADTLPVMTTIFEVAVGDQRISLSRPVRFRYVDRLRGELLRPLTIVPAVALNLPEPVLVFTNGQPRKLEVVLHANAETAAGELHIEADRGWKVEPAVLPFQMKSTGEERQNEFHDHPGRILGPKPAGRRTFACSAL